MKLSKREKILIIMVLVIIALLAYIFLFLMPRLDETKKLQSQNITNEATIQTNKVLKQRIDEIIKQLNEDEKQLADFGDNIKSAFDQPPVLVYISDIIKNRNCEKLSISFDDEIGELGQVKYRKVLVTMKAKYEDLKNVLKDFSDGEYFVKVVNLNAQLSVKEVSKTDTITGNTDTAESSFTDNFSESEFLLEDKLSVGMDLEFYYIGTEIPADKTYDFTDGAVQYGGNIFRP